MQSTTEVINQLEMNEVTPNGGAQPQKESESPSSSIDVQQKDPSSPRRPMTRSQSGRPIRRRILEDNALDPLPAEDTPSTSHSLSAPPAKKPKLSPKLSKKRSSLSNSHSGRKTDNGDSDEIPHTMITTTTSITPTGPLPFLPGSVFPGVNVLAGVEGVGTSSTPSGVGPGILPSAGTPTSASISPPPPFFSAPGPIHVPYASAAHAAHVSGHVVNGAHPNGGDVSSLHALGQAIPAPQNAGSINAGVIPNGSANLNAYTATQTPQNTIPSASTNTKPPAERIGTTRIMRATLPVPVPNLTKKSRGRRVPVRVLNSTPEAKGAPEEESASTAGAGTSTGEAVVVSTNGKEVKDLDRRSYVCSVEGCGKCFHRGEHLKRHIRSIHTHEKPFKCTFPSCDKHFNRHDNLLQHIKVHKAAEVNRQVQEEREKARLASVGESVSGGDENENSKAEDVEDAGEEGSVDEAAPMSGKGKGRAKAPSGAKSRGRGKTTTSAKGRNTRKAKSPTKAKGKGSAPKGKAASKGKGKAATTTRGKGAVGRKRRRGEYESEEEEEDELEPEDHEDEEDVEDDNEEDMKLRYPRRLTASRRQSGTARGRAQRGRGTRRAAEEEDDEEEFEDADGEGEYDDEEEEQYEEDGDGEPDDHGDVSDEAAVKSLLSLSANRKGNSLQSAPTAIVGFGVGERHALHPRPMGAGDSDEFSSNGSNHPHYPHRPGFQHGSMSTSVMSSSGNFSVASSVPSSTLSSGVSSVFSPLQRPYTQMTSMSSFGGSVPDMGGPAGGINGQQVMSPLGGSLGSLASFGGMANNMNLNGSMSSFGGPGSQGMFGAGGSMGSMAGMSAMRSTGDFSSNMHMFSSLRTSSLRESSVRESSVRERESSVRDTSRGKDDHEGEGQDGEGDGDEDGEGERDGDGEPDADADADGDAEMDDGESLHVPAHGVPIGVNGSGVMDEKSRNSLDTASLQKSTAKMGNDSLINDIVMDVDGPRKAQDTADSVSVSVKLGTL